MRQHIPTTKRHVLEPKQMRRFLADISPCGAGEEPEQVVGWSKKGKWTRLKATYPNGWELSVNFDREERVSSWSAKLSLSATFRLPEKLTANGLTVADSDGDDSA